MKLSDFFQNFYFSRSEGGLISHKSQNAIPEFFFESALKDEFLSQLPTSRSAYSKWMGDERHPNGALLALVSNQFDDDKLFKKLLRELDEIRLPRVMSSFGIELENGEQPNKRQFAISVCQQFKALVDGNGEAENIIPGAYKSKPRSAGYDSYLWHAAKKLKYMQLPHEDENLLERYFVCNEIGTSSIVFPRKRLDRIHPQANLQSIRTYDKRGETRCTILIGACGYGKTLMLQHLFLDAVKQHDKTGLLPVFAELRGFSKEIDDLVDFIVETVQEYDTSFRRESVVDLLEKGQLQLLLDGLDELDPGEVKHFQKKLSELCSRYPDNQVVITSRQCSAINGIRFTKLYLQPLDDDQIDELIDKLLADEEHPDNAKSIIASFFDKRSIGYLSKNSFIASNPLLLTIIVRNYHQLNTFAGDRIRFYDLLYHELIRGHDEEKPAFDRIFHSVINSEEFTNVYREFCAQAYIDGVDSFDQHSFEKYYKIIKERVTLNYPSAFQLQTFQHDVCATACMMYEQETGIYYIDHGFQDYFFALHYYHADPDSAKNIKEAIEKRDIDSFRNLLALRMMYQKAPDKVETYMLLPYLDGIFRGKDDEAAFIEFLSSGFGKLIYTEMDDSLIQKCLSKFNSKDFYCKPEANHVNNILMAFILDMLGLPNNFIIGARTSPISRDENTTFYLFAIPLAVKENPDLPGKWILNAIKREISGINDNEFYINTQMPAPVLDDDEKPVCLGYEHSIDPQLLKSRRDVLELLKQKMDDINPYEIFIEVRKLYERLTDKRKRNAYR